MSDAALFLLIFATIVPSAALLAAIAFARHDTAQATGHHAAGVHSDVLDRLRGHVVGLTVWTTIKLGPAEARDRKGLAA